MIDNGSLCIVIEVTVLNIVVEVNTDDGGSGDYGNSGNGSRSNGVVVRRGEGEGVYSGGLA